MQREGKENFALPSSTAGRHVFEMTHRRCTASAMVETVFRRRYICTLHVKFQHKLGRFQDIPYQPCQLLPASNTGAQHKNV